MLWMLSESYPMLCILSESFPMLFKLSKCYQMLSKVMDVMNVKKHLVTFLLYLMMIFDHFFIYSNMIMASSIAEILK